MIVETVHAPSLLYAYKIKKNHSSDKGIAVHARNDEAEGEVQILEQID
jgi:hypothetical protein